jgi:myo-inositol-1(or 4)-monophosphatase
MAASALMNVMIGAARKAGRGLTRDFGEVEQLQVSVKGPGNFVSAADHRSEETIFRELSKARPGYGFLMEERGHVPGNDKTHRWIVDPLDGTTNYLYGFPGFNVSIAAEIDERAMVGVVYDVVRDELFSAVRGRGATRDGEPIRPTPAADLAHALVGTGFSYDPERRGEQARVLVDVLPRVRDVRRQGAAAVDLCSVACGRLDAYYERGLAPWDLAAGGLIATEAGAEVTDFDGSPARSGAVVAAAPGIAVALRELLATTAAARA